MDLYNKYNTSEWGNRKETMRRKRLVTMISASAAALFILSLLLLSSCEKKDLCYLDAHPHICHTQLTLKFNTAWDNEPIYSNYTRTVSTVSVRYVLEFWTMDDDGRLKTQLERKIVNGGTLNQGSNSHKVNVDLPAEKIAVLAWAEPLASGQTANPYFDATSLSSVKMLEPFGAGATKDAFSGSTTWDYSGYGVPHSHSNDLDFTEELELLRPFGTYTVISNDMEEYFEKMGADAPEPHTAKVNYQMWIPPMFDTFRQVANGSQSGATFEHPVSVHTEGKEYKLAEDLIFIGPGDGADNYYNIIVETHAADGSSIHKSGNAEIRMQRNKHTLVYGAFLTVRKPSSPGIDDDFEEIIEIVIPD